MPTIRDVAKQAGVAPITVSRVLNRSGYVSQAVRERVEAAIADLHYIPNMLGASLRSSQTHILALILSDITNPFWTTVARGVEDAANQHGYYVVFCNTDESRTKQDEYVTVMLKKRIDGFLLVPAGPSLDTIQLIKSQRVPLVVLDRQVGGQVVDVVRGDSEGGAYQLTRHLLAQGHRHIVSITGLPEVATAIDRVAGYRRAMADAGLSVSESDIYWGRFSPSHGYAAMQTILQNSARPTAIVAGNNFIAVGAMHALREAGIQVPQGMAVVSFDDFPTDLTIDPFLTCAAQPAYEMGYRATGLLISHILSPGESPYQDILLPVEVIIRESSRYVLPSL